MYVCMYGSNRVWHCAIVCVCILVYVCMYVCTCMCVCVSGICFATKSANAEKARSSIREAFFYELKQGMVSDITVIAQCSIIAAVGL